MGRFRKRRSSRPSKTRIRYQPATARNQKKQIYRIAKLSLRNKRILDSQRTYADWFYGLQTDALEISKFKAFSIISPTNWTSTMREDLNVDDANNTWLRNVNISFACQSPTNTARMDWTLYLVTLRYHASDWTPVSPTTSLDNLRGGLDYTYVGRGNAPVLNPQTFRLHAKRHFTTYPPALGEPSTLMQSGHMNKRLGFQLAQIHLQSNPGGLRWVNMIDDDVLPMNRYYVLIYPDSTDVANTAQIQLGCVFTTLSSN